MTDTLGKSPYARKGKRPHVYSDQYKRWAAAVTDYGPAALATQRADREFRDQWDVCGDQPPRKRRRRR